MLKSGELVDREPKESECTLRSLDGDVALAVPLVEEDIVDDRFDATEDSGSDECSPRPYIDKRSA